MVPATNTIDGGAAITLPAMMGPLSTTSASSSSSSAASAADDPNKKLRKPYTITKSRESWTEQEHDKFLEALQLFDRDWKKIEAFVGSKTVIQIRSHAQKYFLKVQKNGTSEHVPPPRPKRKAAHPYPQKASSKNAYQASSCLLEPGYVPRTDLSSVLRSSSTSGTMSSWAHCSVHPRSAHMTKENIGPARTMVSNNCCSSTESPISTWLACETFDQENHVPSLHVMPDFAQVYSFIGSIFDPNTSGHLEKLKEMDPIDVEAVFMLMRNLSFNLTSPDFEDHRKLLASYEASSEKINSVNATDTIESDNSVNGSFIGSCSRHMKPVLRRSILRMLLILSNLTIV